MKWVNYYGKWSISEKSKFLIFYATDVVVGAAAVVVILVLLF